MRVLFAAFAVLLAVVVSSQTSARAQAATTGACGGVDLLEGLKTSDPGALVRIDEAAGRIVNGEALLWKIERKGSPPSHLFGTIHVSDVRVATLSPAVELALSKSQTVALEIADLSPKAFEAAIQRVPELIAFSDGRDLTTLLNESEFEAARAIARDIGFPDEVAKLLKPWLYITLLAMPACERKRVEAGVAVLDQTVGNRHRKRGLAVKGLETIEDQLRAMASIPEVDQVAMLKVSLANLTRAEDLFETIIQRYAKREIAKVWPMQIEMARAAGFDEKRLESFWTEIISKRNFKMRDAALPLIKRGGAFVAVGALHLIGDDGLVALLRQVGLKVTAVE